MAGSGVYNKYPKEYNFKGLRVLNIGCGFEQFKFENVTNLDAYDICDPDVVWDLNVTPLPFEDNTFDFIIANHILEHVEMYWPLFNDCARILKPDGHMEVWGPGDGTDGQLGYRDHVNIINQCSFFGIFQNYRYGGNAYAEATSVCPANRMKMLNHIRRMEYKWWIRYAPQSLVNWMGQHLRNVVAEQGMLFRKITDEEWANEQATRDKRRAYQNAQVLRMQPASVPKRQSAG
jgi:SAM-dependent methyltransferase